MISLEEIIYDVKEIKNALEDDTNLEDEWILFKINNYRSILIAEQCRMEPVINPAWLQAVAKFDFTKTDAADDPIIAVNSVTLGRATLPAVVSLPDNLGLNRLTGSGAIIGFEPTDFDSLVMRGTLGVRPEANYGWYAMIGNMAYVYPYIMEGKAIVIAEDPTSIQIYTGTEYRDFTLADPYPIDAKLAQAIVLQILTVDLKLNDQSITDVVNDSQDQLRIMKDASTQKKG